MKRHRKYLQVLGATAVVGVAILGTGFMPVDGVYADVIDKFEYVTVMDSTGPVCSYVGTFLNEPACGSEYGTITLDDDFDDSWIGLKLTPETNNKTVLAKAKNTADEPWILFEPTREDADMLVDFDFDGLDAVVFAGFKTLSTDAIQNKETRFSFWDGVYNLGPIRAYGIGVYDGAKVNISSAVDSVYGLFGVISRNIVVSGTASEPALLSVKDKGISAQDITVGDSRDDGNYSSIDINISDDSVRDGIELTPFDNDWQNTTNGLEIFNGNVSINFEKPTNNFGIYSPLTSSEISINGDSSNLTITNARNGIFDQAGAGVVEFNGGTTTIKNAKGAAIYVENYEDPENAIKLGDGMGIKEPNIPILWDDIEGEEYGYSGIIAEDIVTITSGYEYKKEKGKIDFDIFTELDEIPETSGGEEEAEETAEEESDVKTPDTGIFSGETEQSTLLAISLGAVATTTSVLGLALYATKRFAARAKFNK